MTEPPMADNTVDESSDEGMLREAHDVLRLAMNQWADAPMPWAWLAADLMERLTERFPEAKDVVPRGQRAVCPECRVSPCYCDTDTEEDYEEVELLSVIVRKADLKHLLDVFPSGLTEKEDEAVIERLWKEVNRNG